MTAAPAVVIPNWNGRDWLSGCLDSIAAQTLQPSEVVVVDNGSTDGSLELLAERQDVRTIGLGRNTGFAFAVNRGVEAVGAEIVALVNNDVVLEPDWLERMVATLRDHPEAASVASKTGVLYDQAGEAFSACAGAALYRREAVLAAGGFEERYFAYLEDVDLGL
ncbi:MAG: hypothetical protein QOJ14_1914, partial [Thermoleophilaceae bacterium]|nr:hypothetical protein [Thermoleophilaceae bacterium]